MTTLRDTFYAERDQRTSEYGVLEGYLNRPAVIRAEHAAVDCPRGQLTLLALLNMIARMHRRIILDFPDVEALGQGGLAVVPHNRSTGLREVACSLALGIDPFLSLEFTDRMPENAIGVGLGKLTHTDGIEWYIGSQGNLVTLSRDPQTVDASPAFCLGPCLAACIGAWALFRQAAGLPVQQQQISAWNLRHGSDARPGPAELAPVDVGSVLMLGAGGVGACLAYWLRQATVLGNWRVVDADVVKLHNTNRSLCFLPGHAGWPDGKCQAKAEVAAQQFGALPLAKWADEVTEEERNADLLLVLANERSVRRAARASGDPLVLHATTSEAFESQLHRHIAGVDDCILCRLPPEDYEASFGCSVVPVKTEKGSQDAALPFLSATSGLMLLSALYRLQYGELQKEDANWWSIVFSAPHRLTRQGRRKCSVDCAGIPRETVRARAHQGKRWFHLDPASRLL